MSTGSISTRAPRQAAKTASTKFEAQLMSSPVKQPSPVKPAKPAKGRPNLKTATSSKRSVGLSKSAPLRQGPRKRHVSLDSHRSDDDESDLTSLSTPSASPVLKSASFHAEEDADDACTHRWILVDFKGAVFRLEDEDDGEERIWWPGQILPTPKPNCRVRLFGTLRTSSRAVVVDTPHSGNILPFAADDEIRFTKPVYYISSPASPRKRLKLDRAALEAKWMAALSEAVHDHGDEIPSTSFLHSVRGIPPHVPSLQARPVSDDELGELSDAPTPERGSPAAPDESLDIPGELILAREDKSPQYWPARILGYIPPSESNRDALYQIEWMSGETVQIPRDSFYSDAVDEFGTCKLGKFESTFQEVVNDTDEPDTPLASRRPRGLSPEPLDPPPGKEEFCELTVHEQFVYAKPVLQAILRDEYPPAHAKHTQFIAGGVSKQNYLMRAASQARGLMDPKHVDEFHHCLLDWCLRDTARVVKKPELEYDDLGVGEEMQNSNDEEVFTEAVDACAEEIDGVQKSADACSDADDPAVAVVDSAVGNEDPAMQERLCNPPSPTPTTLDDTSSPALPPPSSSFSFATTDVSMEVEEAQALDEGAPLDDATCTPDADVDTTFGDAFDTASILSEASDVSILVSVQKPPPQVGCPEYEQLRPLRKLEYCMNVLLPELLIQINVWRTGKRTSVELLSAEEEAELHALGVKEGKKKDWVWDVMRMRKMKETELENRKVKVGGTTSRPKRALKPV
ncbi:hypothetical protein K438DRAFT_2014511 [Mycena galopus ATCC 62051]|nr:hypothetical protein K438DRAFT_2014511 [Mycena galopus ATCC 62051]